MIRFRFSISRSSRRICRSRSTYSCSVISPNSSFTCNSRSFSLIGPVSVYSSCATLARVRNTNFSPVTGRSSRSSTRNIKQNLELGTRAMLIGREPLQLQAYVHKIVRRPWTGVFELQALFVFFRDLVDHGVELRFAIALDQESGIHNHLVADRLVIARSYAYITERLVISRTYWVDRSPRALSIIRPSCMRAKYVDC